MGLVLSTLLASYCRADIYSFGGKPPVIMSISDDGLYFFALPAGASNVSAHWISNEPHEIERGVRTEIKFTPTRAEVIDPLQTDNQDVKAKVASVTQHLANVHWKVFALQVPTSVWLTQAFFSYIIDYTLKQGNSNSLKRCYVAFFKSTKEDPSLNFQKARSAYVRHVISDNLTPYLSEESGFYRYKFNKKTMELEKAKKPVAGQTFDSEADQDGSASATSPTMPQNQDQYWFIPSKKTDIGWSDSFKKLSNEPPGEYDLLIAPSVTIREKNFKMTRPSLHEYADILFLYLDAIRSSWKALPQDSKEFTIINNNVGSQDSYSAWHPISGTPLVTISTFVAHRGRHASTISVSHSNIARLLFGSAQEWPISEVEGGAVVMYKTRGFGCLNEETCKVTSDDNYRLHGLYDNMTRNPDSAINELLGRSSAEIDKAIFVDSNYYRSTQGTYNNYYNRLSLEVGNNTVALTSLRASITNCYKDVFDSFFGEIIKEIYNNKPASEHVDQFSIQILQSYLRYKGYKKKVSGKTVSGEFAQDGEATKLVYQVDSKNHHGTVFGEDIYKRPEGGLFLVCPKAEAGLDSADANEKFKSATCPFGYVAKSCYEYSKLIGGHLDFFSTVGITTSQEMNSVVSIIKPTNYEAQKTTYDNGGKRSDGSFREGTKEYTSTNCQFFTNLRGSEEDAKRQLQIKMDALHNIKDVWKNYILTKDYIDNILKEPSASLEPEVAKTKASEYRFLLIAIRLAVELRERYQRQVLKQKGRIPTRYPNIYEIMPYNNEYSNAPKDIEGSNLYKNFVSNCDKEFQTERALLLSGATGSYERNVKNGRPLLIDILNIDVIHGYILSQNYEINKEWSWRGLLQRDQYLALSASVFLTENGYVRVIDFQNEFISSGNIPDSDSSSSSSSDSSSSDSDDDSASATSKPKDQVKETPITFENSVRLNPGIVECYTGSPKEEEYVNTFRDPLLNDNLVYANIADVPVYNVNQNGNIYVATMEETLSMNTINMVLLSRSLAFNGVQKKKVLKFFFVIGKPEIIRHNITSGVNEFITGGTAFAGGIGSKTTMKAISRRAMASQEQPTEVLITRTDKFNFLRELKYEFEARLREENSKAKQPSVKWLRSTIILDFSRKDVSSLTSLKPLNHNNSHLSTLAETYDNLQMKSRRRAGQGNFSERTSDYSATQVDEFLQSYKE